MIIGSKWIESESATLVGRCMHVFRACILMYMWVQWSCTYDWWRRTKLIGVLTIAGCDYAQDSPSSTLYTQLLSSNNQWKEMTKLIISSFTVKQLSAKKQVAKHSIHYFHTHPLPDGQLFQHSPHTLIFEQQLQTLAINNSCSSWALAISTGSFWFHSVIHQVSGMPYWNPLLIHTHRQQRMTIPHVQLCMHHSKRQWLFPSSRH